MAIDSVTGLPDLSSDVYQIPLNTDSLPYKDLQAEARLPRQPLLPDDIIPTVALLTGLDSDNTGQVVHTDDNHAAKVYVVNQPTSGGVSSNGPYPVVNHTFQETTEGFSNERLGFIDGPDKAIRGVSMSWAFAKGSGTEGQAIGYISPYILTDSGDSFYLCSISVCIGPDGTCYKIAGEDRVAYPGGFLVSNAHVDAFGRMVVYLSSVNIGGGALNLNIWQDA